MYSRQRACAVAPPAAGADEQSTRAVASGQAVLPGPERALVFEQSQVVQRIVDGSFAFVAARVFSDDLTARDDHDAVNVGLDQNLAMTELGRHRVIVGAVANQRDRADACGRLIAGLEGCGRQRQKHSAVTLEALTDGLRVAAQTPRATGTAVAASCVFRSSQPPREESAP